MSRAPLPELVVLDLSSSFVVDDAMWQPLLDGLLFPKLEHLGIGVYSFLAGRAGPLIANAPILKQLKRLDLSRTILGGPEVAGFLVSVAHVFAHLERLDVGWILTDDPAVLRPLLALCPDVRVNGLKE